MKQSLKKLIVIPLAATFLASCAGNDNGSSDSSSQAQSSSQTSSTTTSSSSSSSSKEVIHVEGITLSQTTAKMYIGGTLTLTATVTPSNADNKAYTWSTSNAEVATVTTGGVVSALKTGTATITATTADGSKTATCAITVAEDVYEFGIQGKDGPVETLTKDLNVDLNKTDTVQLIVRKNGTTFIDGNVTRTITGATDAIASVAEDSDVDFKYITTFSGNATGAVTVTYALTGHEDLGTLTVTYNVTEYFFNQTIKRGNNTESNGTMSFAGGDQHTAVVKKADTKWMLKAKLTFAEYTGTEAIGLGSFADLGDRALWFSFGNNDNQADEYGRVYIRDFFEGWGAAKYDTYAYEAYNKVKFGTTEDGSSISIDCTLIRNGLNYYFDIGGYHGKYTSDYSEATYAGFFSQTKAATISNYSIDYAQSAIDAAIAADYGENAKLDAGSFKNANTGEIVRGESRTFTVLTAPTYSTEEYTMTADEKYAEHVTIEGTKVTIGENATEGYMTLTLKSASGKALDTITLPVMTQSSEKSNDQVTVKGGVILNDDGSFVFPESKIDIDGIAHEEKYKDSEYGVKLKQTVLGGDFSIEFDVENYVKSENQQYPKLMVSLGGASSQFYVVYNREGTINRIETHTVSSQYYGGQWNNAAFADDFNTTIKHHFKIESKNGYYNFYVDNSETPLTQKCDNDDRNIIVPMSSYYNQLPVRMATRGVSAKVSNLTVTSGNVEDLPNIYTYGTRATSIDGGVQTTFPNETAWGVSDRVSYGMFQSKLFANATGAYKATFNLKFSKVMTDAKLAISFGSNREMHICNAGTASKLQAYRGSWNDAPNLDNIALGDGEGKSLTLPVTVEADGAGSVTVSLPLADGTTGSLSDGDIPVGGGLFFYSFNQKAEDNDATVQITDVVIEAK